MQLEFITPNSPRWRAILDQVPHDIYHLPQYVQLEAQRTGTIPEAVAIAADERLFFVPYLIRSCEDIAADGYLMPESFDIVSPYGYPGIVVNAAAQSPDFLRGAMAALKGGLQAKGVCSAFFRLHPILNGVFGGGEIQGLVFQGETVSVDLHLSEADIWSHTKRDHRNKINRCRRAGLTAEMVPCAADLPEFVEIYLETMDRVGAADRYRAFDLDYFSQLLGILGERLHLCLVKCRGEVASAGLYTEWQGIVQAIFGGTRSRYVKQSPSTLETDFVRIWAKQRGNRFLHLGGGVGATQDPLFRFKAGFSKQRHDFYTLRWVTDDDRYQSLVELRAKAQEATPEALLATSFFPAYRASIGESHA